MMSLKKLVCLSAAIAAAMVSWAVEVTPEQASTAVRNWIGKNPKRMTAKFKSSLASAVKTSKNAKGRALYHVVSLDGGGYVVAAGDTELPPVIAFSESGHLDLEDKGNPMLALLESDMGRRIDFVDGTPTASTKTAKFSSAEYFKSEWAELTSATVGTGKKGIGESEKASLSSLSDVRVSPLVQSQWGQSTWDGYNTFNYYTPDNYVCGCVATAFAQIMRYWQKPVNSVTAWTRTCRVNGSLVQKTMFGGSYSWSDMPLTSSACSSTTQRQAIGKLLYDLGVASQMDWGEESGTMGFAGSQALKNVFGYASSQSYFDVTGYGLEYELSSQTDFRDAILASLDAGMPCAVGVGGSMGGHEMVLDGYGFSGSVIYSHINCGWSGSEDAWYDFFGEYVTSFSFAYMDELGYNIHPTTTGDVLSGRVLDSSGNPVSGATVTLTFGGTTRTTSTNGKGIYYFRISSAGSYTVSATYGSQTSSTTATVATMSAPTTAAYNSSCEWSESASNGTLGNKWGVNLTLAGSGPTTTLQSALDNTSLTFTTGGNASWSGQTSQTHDGVDAAQSGSIGNSQSSWLQTTVSGTGTISFWWKVDSESRYDLLELLVDGTVVDSISGTGVSWTRKTYQISSSGFHTIQWRYRKDGSVSSGLDAGFVDQVTWSSANTITVSFNSNGGSSCSSRQYTVGSTYGSLPEPTKTGYTFVGWYANSSLTTRIYVSSTVSSSVTTLYAKWTPRTYTVTLYRNDGSSTRRQYSSVSAGNWTLPSLSSLSWSRSGYAFLGWSTSSTATSVTYSNGQRISISGPVTLYAVWRMTWEGALNTTSLTFTSGGSASWYAQTSQTHDGTGAMRSGSISHNQSSWLQTTVSGAGTISFWWYVNSESGWDFLEFLVDGTVVDRISGTGGSWTRKTYQISSSGSHTIRWRYRKDGSVSSGLDAGFVDQVAWTPTAKYTVTFNANGGSGSMAAQQFTQGVSQRLTANAFWRTGYTFAGWATSPGGAVVYSDSQSVRMTSNRTLYATWSEIVAGRADTYFAKAQKSDGALYRGGTLVGTVQVKFGKVSNKNTVKVSATATVVVGGKIKKVMARAVDVNLGAMRAVLTFRDPVGSLMFEMKDDGTYTLRSGSYFMAAASVGGAQSRARTFKLTSFDLAVPGEIQTALLPYNVAFTEAGGKWKFAKAASVRVTKNQVSQTPGIRHEADVVVVDDSAGKTNLSALKLMYTAKTGQFKGSFKVYALVEENGRRKLAKYTVSVAGFVVNGTGHGEASCSRPAGGPWAVTVE